MTQQSQERLTFDDPEAARALLGTRDAHLKLLAEAVGVAAHSRGGQVWLEGSAEQTGLARLVLTQLYDLIRQGYPVYDMDVDFAVRILSADPAAVLKDIFLDQVYITGKKRIIDRKSVV